MDPDVPFSGLREAKREPSEKIFRIPEISAEQDEEHEECGSQREGQEVIEDPEGPEGRRNQVA